MRKGEAIALHIVTQKQIQVAGKSRVSVASPRDRKNQICHMPTYLSDTFCITESSILTIADLTRQTVAKNILAYYFCLPALFRLAVVWMWRRARALGWLVWLVWLGVMQQGKSTCALNCSPQLSQVYILTDVDSCVVVCSFPYAGRLSRPTLLRDSDYFI